MKKNRKIAPKNISIQKIKEENLKLEQIIKHPNVLGFLEFITGTIGTDKSDLLMASGRVAQAIFKRETIKQLGVEIFELRKKGKINEEYIESEYGKKSFIDLLKAIDEENMDPNKWEAIKKVYYFSISSDSKEKKRKKAYYLMQTCLQLKSFDIEVLSFCYQKYIIPNNGTDSINAAGDWIKLVSDGLGYDLPEFVEQSETKLINLGILTGRTYSDKSGIVKGTTFRLTNLGINLCEIIE